MSNNLVHGGPPSQAYTDIIYFDNNYSIISVYKLKYNDDVCEIISPEALFNKKDYYIYFITVFCDTPHIYPEDYLVTKRKLLKCTDTPSRETNDCQAIDLYIEPNINGKSIIK